VKEDTEIARVAERGAVFGELSVLLDQPHTAEVCALETSQFHVADAAGLLARDPMTVLYRATVLARRLNAANQYPLNAFPVFVRPVVAPTVREIEWDCSTPCKTTAFSTLASLLAKLKFPILLQSDRVPNGTSRWLRID
jgi:CRP-like cAMP-binding protein